MKFKVLVTIGALLGFALVLFGIKAWQFSAAMAQWGAPPPEAVTSVRAAITRWEDELHAVGSLAAVQGVTLSAEEAGKVEKINFESGAQVKAGDVIISLDTTVEEAELVAAEAQANLGRVEFKRAQSLRPKGAISESDYNQAEANVKAAEANAAAIRARIQRKQIIAPFDGRLGIRLVNLGQFVTQGQEIIPLESLNPMFVNFALPQDVIGQVHTSLPMKATVDAYPGREFTGSITAINPIISNATRNFSVQAVIQNPEELLRPGMFARVTVTRPTSNEYITIPLTSLSSAPYGTSVYVIEKMKDDKDQEYSGVRQKFVTLGPRRGDQIAIIKGLVEGEEVVTSGVFKLRPGAAVQVNNTISPGNDPNPQPQNT